MPVENRLDIARKIQHVGMFREGLNTAGRMLHRQQQTARFVFGRPVAGLVAAYAPGRFPGHDTRKALHAFDGKILGVQGHEKQLPARRHFKIGRTVRLDWHRPQNPLEGEGASQDVKSVRR